MKKILLTVIFLACICVSAHSQVVSIRPDSAIQGQALTTYITMTAGSFTMASPPYSNTDIYLQQGATIIYADPSYQPYLNVYTGCIPYFCDSMHVDFTIPGPSPLGLYDLHVVTYDIMSIPTDNVLPSSFEVKPAAGTIEGDVYFDTNQNGVWDGGEPPLLNHRVQLAPTNTIAYTDTAGHYKAYLSPNTYTASYLPPNTFSQTSVPLTYTGTVPPSYTGYDFGSFSSQALYNQYFYVWHHPMRCEPAYGYTYIDIVNNGVMPVQGSVTMVYSSNMTLNPTLPAPSYVNGDTVRWTYSALASGQSFHIRGAGGSWMSFVDPPAGQTIWYTTIDSVFDLLGNSLTQYTDSFGFVVTCSCDPNDKEVSPYGTTAQHYTPPNTELTYTINFQNTGNDTAFTVVITDTLDANLDWNTFEVISSTDPVNTQMDANGVLTFTFPNILLPDSNVDEPGSHGAVAYHIRTDSLLPDPTVISNTAYIYFDLNPAVITNTAFNTITALQFPSASFVTGDVSFCPGNCINFSNLSSPGNSYQWSFPGGNPSSSNDPDPTNICYTVSGNYDVELIATNALGSDTLTISNYLEVYPVASQAITQSGDTLFANQGFVSYVWYYNGNVINGATDYFYIATQNGDYNVISFDANGCDVEAAAFNVMTDVNIIANTAVEIYPNPVEKKLIISDKSLNGPGAEISIFNVLGKMILAVHSEAGSRQQETTIDVSSLPSGIYMVEVKGEQGTYRAKVVKQ